MPEPFAFTREQIVAAATQYVYPAMPPTPQYRWPLLERRAGRAVWVKHENHSPVGSFKVRGGLVWVGRRAERLAPAGLIAATRGNHGQSIAFAARQYAIPVTMVVPHGNAAEKNAAMVALGATLIEHGDDFDDALAHARHLAEQRGLTFAPSLDPDLALGIASYAVELFRAVPTLAVVYVPVGQGSGIAATMAARDAVGASAEVVAVVSAAYPAYAVSWSAGQLTGVPATGPTVADGVACRMPDPRGLALMRAGASRILTIAESDIRQAMRHYFTDTHQVAEGAGALALAACLTDPHPPEGPAGVILTGGNVDRAVFADVLAR